MRAIDRVVPTRRRRTARAVVIMGLVALGGCVRAGFGLGDAARRRDEGATADLRKPAADQAGASTYLVTKAHDTCATPLVVDLASGPKQRILKVDTTGAAADYPGLFCTTADVIIKLVASPGGWFSFATAPATAIVMVYPSSAGQACPPSGSFTSLGNLASNILPSGNVYLRICHPSGDPVETITMTVP